jgi:flagellar protein FlbD
VTRLNGIEYLLNPHLFESIEANPDTIITLVSGKKVVIRETPEQICESIIQYRKKLGILGNED